MGIGIQAKYTPWGRSGQSPAVLVRTEFVTGHEPKNLSEGRSLKVHVAADQQP